MAPAQLATPSRSRKASLTTEEDLDAAWNKTIAECQDITKWNLDNKNVPTIENIIERIHPPKDNGKRKLKDQARSAFKNALTCIERFGQVAAQGASMV